MKKIKIKFIDNWKDGWKFISVNCMWLSIAIQTSWVYLPDDLRTSFPQPLVTSLSVTLLLIGIVGRFIDQYLKQPKNINDNTFEKSSSETDIK